MSAGAVGIQGKEWQKENHHNQSHIVSMTRSVVIISLDCPHESLPKTAIALIDVFLIVRVDIHFIPLVAAHIHIGVLIFRSKVYSPHARRHCRSGQAIDDIFELFVKHHVA